MGRVLLFFFLVVLFFSLSQAQVDTFTYVNEGEFGPYITENDANYRALPPYSSPFQMCFYNTTPGQFYLALRMGTLRSESTFRWVWRANPFAPVRDNATFSLLADGNLVLANPDGSIVWSTSTANKGVVGMKIVPGGNIVLYDSKGQFIWQSFDHPTDTLLVGQSLRVDGPTELVSRNGAYSFVLEPKRLAMYINNINATAKHLLYGILTDRTNYKITSAKFESEPETDELGYAYAYQLGLSLGPNLGTAVVGRPKYNGTLSFLRIEEDGNLVTYTFYDPVDYRAWEKTFAYFSDDIGLVSGCSLPSKCGGLGLCDSNEMCVTCPTKEGLLGWSESCSTPALGKCTRSATAEVDYYKVVGVENFLTSFGKGSVMKAEECNRRCSSNCKCLGFFYWELESKCWLAPLIGTLAEVSNSTHVAYVKYVK